MNIVQSKHSTGKTQQSPITMYVTKRNGTKEEISFDKILIRIQKLAAENPCDQGSLERVDCFQVTQKVINQIYDGIPTTKLDELAAHIAMSMITKDPQYGELASRIAVSNHQKNTSDNFIHCIELLLHNTDRTGGAAPIISEEVAEIAHKYENEFKTMIDYDRD